MAKSFQSNVLPMTMLLDLSKKKKKMARNHNHNRVDNCKYQLIISKIILK